MPCQDVTEVIQVALDPDERLEAYALRKRTCGAEIGEAALLGTWLKGRGVADILALHGDDVLGAFSPSAAEEFLYFKHLVAVQQALRVLCGEQPGAPGEPCVTAVVAAEPAGIEITADLTVELLAERIQACARCCKTGRRDRAERPSA